MSHSAGNQKRRFTQDPPFNHALVPSTCCDYPGNQSENPPHTCPAGSSRAGSSRASQRFGRFLVHEASRSRSRSGTWSSESVPDASTVLLRLGSQASCAWAHGMQEKKNIYIYINVLISQGMILSKSRYQSNYMSFFLVCATPSALVGCDRLLSSHLVTSSAHLRRPSTGLAGHRAGDP